MKTQILMLTTQEPEPQEIETSNPVIASPVEVARVPVAVLRDRIGKRKLYEEYLPVLQITPIKAGKFSYVTAEEARLIDGYHLARDTSDDAKLEFLERHGLLENHNGNAANLSNYEPYPSSPTPITLELINLANRLKSLDSIARYLASGLVLQAVAANGLPLTKKVLLEILERRSLPSHASGTFDTRGFQFTQVGHGSNELWTVAFSPIASHSLDTLE